MIFVGLAIVKIYDEPRPVIETPPVASTQSLDLPVPTQELAYLEEVLHALSQWDKDSLKPLLAPETLAGASDEQLDQVLGTLERRLGELRTFDSPAPQARMPQPGEPANLAAYRMVAYYDKGAADVSLVLKPGAGSPQVYSFNVEVSQPL